MEVGLGLSLSLAGQNVSPLPRPWDHVLALGLEVGHVLSTGYTEHPTHETLGKSYNVAGPQVLNMSS